MNSNIKQRTVPLFAIIVFVLSLLAAVIFAGVYSSDRFALADEQTNVGETFYRDELKNSELAQKFYAVM